MTLRIINFILLFFLSVPTIAQSVTIDLKLGEPFSTVMKKGEKHNFKLTLTGNQFVRLELDQQGIDVKIVAWQPNGTPIRSFDSPNGANGSEIITLMAKDEGEYFFMVEPFAENAESGRYTFEVKSIESFGETNEKRIDQIMSIWDTDSTPGISLAVVQNGKVVFSKGYGMANLEYDIPIETNSIFHVASISKQVTAFAILLLAEEGKLSLDDDIRKYISEVPNFGYPITLRHLATHTSGLRDQWNLLKMAGWRMDDVITTDQVLKLIAKQKELNFLPGEEFLYCNTGFTLLAEIVEEVSGMTFAEFTQKHIFEPLKMSNTQFYDDHEKIVKNRVYSYIQETGGYRKANLNYSIPGATSLFTTPEDLAKWVLNFENPVIGTSESMRQMQTKGVLNNGDSTNYALGLGINYYNGLLNVSHGGADAGFRTYLSRFPNQKFAVIVFGNDGAFSPGTIANQISDLYLSDLYVEEIEKKEPKSNTLMKEKLAPEFLEKYIGEYAIDQNFTIKISLIKGKLYGEATGQEIFEMNPETPTLFKIKDAKARISFHQDTDGTINMLKLHQNGSIT